MSDDKVTEYFQIWLDYFLKLKTTETTVPRKPSFEDVTEEKSRKRPFEDSLDDNQSPKKKSVEVKKEIVITKNLVSDKLTVSQGSSFHQCMNLVNQEAEKLIGANQTLEQITKDVLKSTIRMKDEKIKTQELIIKELSFKLALLTSEVSSLRLELQISHFSEIFVRYLSNSFQEARSLKYLMNHRSSIVAQNLNKLRGHC